MREIKFRCVRKDGDRYRVYGTSKIIDLWLDGLGHYETMQKELVSFNKGELMFNQYTGLKDKNGIEIFEGDIIMSLDSKGNEIKHLITFDEDKACFATKHVPVGTLTTSGSLYKQWIDEFEKEIIGNIYEHPHLLTNTQHGE